MGCGHRFLEVDQARAEDVKLLLTGAALLVFFLAGLATLLYFGTDELRESESLPAQVDREVQHVPKLSGDDNLDRLYWLALAPADGTPADRASITGARDRLLDAAENGNTKAMIYLGLM